MVGVYASAITRAKEDFRPDVVVCVVPEPVERKFWSVSRVLSRTERDALKRTAASATTQQMQLPFDWEVEEQSEDLLTRDFRRALKARAMQIGVPIQLFATVEWLTSRRTRSQRHARGISASGCTTRQVESRGAFAIAARRPVSSGSLFIISARRSARWCTLPLPRRSRQTAEASPCRGQSFEPERDATTRTPHLTEAQAKELGKLVVDEYTARNGELPKRIVLHKSSRFWRQEEEGFLKAFSDVPVVQLVALAPSSVRFVTQGVYPPARGTLVTVDERAAFSVYVRVRPELGTYPGPHIPIPVELIVHGEAAIHDVRECAMDALGLGRLNWNTSDLRSSQPVTLGFARRVGGIMAEYGQLTEAKPDPSYRYYM